MAYAQHDQFAPQPILEIDDTFLSNLTTCIDFSKLGDH